MLSMAPTTEPVSGLAYFERGVTERRLTSSRSRSAVFTGDGGDSSLGAECVGLSAEEYLRRHGLGLKFVKIAAQVAVDRELSLWTVISRSLRRWRYGVRMSEYRDSFLEGCRLLTPEVRQSVLRAERYPHPWFRDSQSVPWRTIYTLGVLCCAPQHYDPFCELNQPSPEFLAPLYNQPVIEICLRIPLYVHFLNGRSRGLTRQAFANCIPEPIVRRIWKDRAPGYAAELFTANLGFFRSVLLDGLLIKWGYLDRELVERALTGSVSKGDIAIGELFNHLDVELWLRRLKEAGHYQAAA